jgi:hypothetical protein
MDLATASGFAQDVAFASGETWYCGFVNQVQPATVDFSNTFVGGPTPPPAFTMHMTSPTNTYTGADGGFVDMVPGTYTVSEDLLPGYLSDAGSCVDLLGTATAGPTITLTNGDLWQCGFTNVYGVATHFSVSGFPSPAVAGASHNVTVTARDALDNTDTTYAGKVHFTSTDGAAVLPADTALTNGTGTFAVTLATEGTQSITATDTVTSSISGSQSGIVVAGPPTIVKAFGAASIAVNGSTSLSFTVQNNNTTTALTGVAFTDTLPVGLVISTPNALTGSCGGGTITATQATNVIGLSGASLAQSGSCAFPVNVTGVATGTQINTTGNVTSTEGGTGGMASASVTINKADQTITFPALTGVRLDQTAPVPGATVDSPLTVTYSTASTACSVTSGGVITLLHAGDCTIDADQGGNGTYNPATRVSRTFAIAKGNQTITFGALAAKTLAQSPVTVGATASSSLAVSFSSNSSSVCTVVGTSVTLLTAGTCSITAAQIGNADWNAASPTVTQTFGVSLTTGGGGGSVVPGPQTITFTLPATGATGSIWALTGSASSGLPLTYTSTTPTVCTVTGSTLNLLTAGTCSVTASQNGDGVTWAAAFPVTSSTAVTLAVAPPTLPILTDLIAAGVNRGSAGFTTASVILTEPGYVTFLARLEPSYAGRTVQIWLRSKTGTWTLVTRRLVGRDGMVHYFARISAWTGFWAKLDGGASHGRIGTVR